MPTYDPDIERHIIRPPDLVYWVADDGALGKCQVVLVTPTRVYLKATSGDDALPVSEGRYWYAPRTTRQLVPRSNAFIRGGRTFLDPSTVLVVA